MIPLGIRIKSAFSGKRLKAIKEISLNTIDIIAEWIMVFVVICLLIASVIGIYKGA